LLHRTHMHISHMLADDLPIFAIISKRIVKSVVCGLMHCNAVVNFTARRSILFECGRSLLGMNSQFCCDRHWFRLRDILGDSFNINRIVRKYCERVCNHSRLAAAQFLLDSIEIRDNFRHSVSLLHFNEVCEVIMQLAMKCTLMYAVYSLYLCIHCMLFSSFFDCTSCTIYIINNNNNNNNNMSILIVLWCAYLMTADVSVD